jgi:hypothetical protein
MAGPTRCFVCGDDAKHGERRGDAIDVTCARCGSYRIAGSVQEEVQGRIPNHVRPLIAAWMRSQNRLGSTPVIDSYNLPALLSLPPPQFTERVRALLGYIAEKTDILDRHVKIAVPEVEALLQTFNVNEIAYVARFLQEQDLILFMDASGTARITGKGIIQADEWRRVRVDSTQGFVAMWFNPDLEAAWTDGLAKAITDAGYKAQRIDKKEHVNKICDEIIAEVRRSRFVVADFTGHRGGVYFEAGYAMGRGLPVIWTCRKDSMKELHFDIRQYNCIDWESPAELAERLQARIAAVIGDGPFKKKK